MTSVQIKEVGLRVVSEKLRRYPTRASMAAAAASRREAQQLHRDIVTDAPKDTGRYAESITLTEHRRILSASFEISTDHPAAARLEFGYVGTDALGRHYNQAPRVHWRNNLYKSQERLPREVGRSIRSAW